MSCLEKSGCNPDPMFRINEALREAFHALDFESVLPPEDWESGIAQIELSLNQLALDATKAVVRKEPFALAAEDYENYPHLSQFHAGVDDILTLRLPKELRRWVFRVLRRREEFEAQVEEGVQSLVDMGPTLQSPWKGLVKFLLFESVRLWLIVDAKQFPHDVFGSGLDPLDLSRIAERCVENGLKQSPGDTLGSLNFMVAEARLWLQKQADDVRVALRRVNDDLRDMAEARGYFEEAMAELDTTTALLLRNTFASEFDQQKFEIPQLRHRHQFALGHLTEDALRKKLRRLKKTRSIPKRRPLFLLDVMIQLKKEMLQ